MPGSILAADAGFPDLSGAGSTEEKLKAISGYLYTLLEQLRYTLNNLGQENFNDTELEILGKTLTKPVLLKLKDAEDSVALLELRADQLSSTVDNMAGDVSKVTQRAEAIETRVTKNESDLSMAQTKLKQTAESLTLEIQERGELGEQVTRIQGSVDGLGISSSSGKTTLSDIALLFHNENGMLVGRMERNAEGDGEEGNAKYRVFVGTENGYALKLESSGDTSYASRTGSIYIKANNDVFLTPGTGRSVKIRDGSGIIYEFRRDGIYYNGKRIVNNSMEVSA